MYPFLEMDARWSNFLHPLAAPKHFNSAILGLSPLTASFTKGHHLYEYGVWTISLNLPCHHGFLLIPDQAVCQRSTGDF